MKYPLYCVRDVKQAFWSPQIEMNDAVAVRNFSFMVNTNNIPAFSPNDFDFYRVGEFDSQKGTIEALDVPEFVCSGSSVFNEK